MKAKISHGAQRQAGSVLIEGLFAILIFSMGILAIVGLQVAAVKQSTEGKYRTDASLLANELIAQMWVSDHRTAAILQSQFNTGNGAYTNWLADVTKVLPGAAANPPTVEVDANSVVTINMYWKASNEAPDDPVHKHTIMAQIR